MFTKDKVEAVFMLAGVEVQGMYEIRNEYGSQEYRGPWWLVKTPYGLVKIGWRKRVLNIDWSDTLLRVKKDAIRDYEFHCMPLTREDTDQGETYIHAWSYGDAIKYLDEFEIRMQQVEYANSPIGIADLSGRKVKYLKEQEVKDKATA